MQEALLYFIYLETGMSKIVNANGWFNATAAAKTFGKDVCEWRRLPSSVKYIAAIQSKCGNLPVIKTQRGNNGGTWLHPKLAVVFARWLSVDFAIWCDEQIDAIVHGQPEKTDWKRVRHEAAAKYKVMSALMEAKEKTLFHYVDETVSLPLEASVKGVGQMFKDSSLINESDLLVTCAAFDATPTTSGEVLIDGVRYAVVQARPVPGVGVPVAWRIVVRRG